MPTLLRDHDPEPVALHNPRGRSAVVLTCDHAGRRVPSELDLGVADTDLERHIGWDIGAWAVGVRLSEMLDAPLVGQRYSRLVIDCNRLPGVVSSIPEESDGTPVPGNFGLDAPSRRAREREVLEPYHDAISDQLDRRGDEAIVVPVHSFTPVLGGRSRPWHVALMNGDDRRLHDALLRSLRVRAGVVVGDNQPYRVEPVDYTVPVHAGERGLACSMIEIRQDLIRGASGQRHWAELLAVELTRAIDGLR